MGVEVSEDGEASAGPTPAPGSLVGRYVVAEPIGAGAMGIVVRAYDPDLDRSVALKVLQRASPDEYASANARLVREAQAMARLSHPNIVRVHDVGEVDGRVFVALDLVDGGTLREWLATPRRLPEILDVFAAAGRGLAAAHDAGLVHRDFKPDNVLVDRASRVFVTDFGLVRVAAPTRRMAVRPVVPIDTEHDITVVGAIVGTPAYMAPEQFEGAEVDERTDQFAFCVTLYEAVYGARPFQGSTVDRLASAVLRGELAPAPVGRRVPSWLRRALVRGLAKHPGDRHASMHDLLDALRAAPRRRRLVGLTALCVAAGASAVAVGSWTRSEPCDAAAEQHAIAAADARRGLDAMLVGEADVLATSARDTLARWLDRWSSAQDAACRATRVTAERSPEALAAAVACLDELHDEADALLRLAASHDVHGSRLLQALSELPEPGACGQLAHRSGDERPADERAAIAETRAAARLGLATSIADDGDVLARERALASADRSAADPTVGAAIERALVEAERSHSPRARARGWVARVTALARVGTSHRELARVASLAHAAIAVAGDDAGWHATVDRLLGEALLREERFGDAVDLLQRSAAWQVQRLGQGHVAQLDATWALGRALTGAGDHERALGTSLVGLAIAEAGYGPDHPITGAIRLELADVIRRSGDAAAADRQRRRGLVALGVGEGRK